MLLLLALTLADAAPRRAGGPPPAPTSTRPEDAYARLLAAADASGTRAWDRLARLTDDVGARPTGSPAYDAAVTWALGELAADGVPAHAEPVSQPRFVRGTERLTLLTPQTRDLALLALGGSVATPGPVEAPVVVVRSFEELDDSVRGKIVLFDVPMPVREPAVAGYGEAVRFRSSGPSAAAEHGAVAALVRSVTTRSLYTPHTGALRYADDVPKIPAAAIPVEDAEQLARYAARGIPVTARLELDTRIEGERPSTQVVAEIKGREHPEEIVLIGAHLDSWDVGTGAHDDGAGVIEVIEAMRLLRQLGVAPRRTVRAVLYANEEWGLSGGKAYAEAHGGELHVVAMETDLGGGEPLAWAASGTDAQLAWLGSALAPLGLPIEGEGGGADISTLEPTGTAMVGLRPDDTHYFDVHHTRADTVDKVDPAALAAGARAVAAFAWLAAEAPDAPRPVPPPAVRP